MKFNNYNNVRSNGEIIISCKSNGIRTELDKLRQSGSLKCLFPNTTKNEIQAVLLNCSGGLTGGDHFKFSAFAEKHSILTLTSQTAERIYCALENEKSIINNELNVSSNAKINWLPQETILFEGSSLKRCLTVNLEKNAELLLSESIVFGRLEMGEILSSIKFEDRINIYRSNKPIFVESVQMKGNIERMLERSAVTCGAKAVSLLIYIAPDAEIQLRNLRRLLPQKAGASLLHKDVIVVRLIADNSYEMRVSLLPILDQLTHKGIPKCWNI